MVEGRNSSGGTTKSTNSCDGLMVAIKSDVKTMPSSLPDTSEFGSSGDEGIVVAFFVVVVVVVVFIAFSTVRSSDRTACDGLFRFRLVVAVVFVPSFLGDGVTDAGAPGVGIVNAISLSDEEEAFEDKEVTDGSCGSASDCRISRSDLRRIDLDDDGTIIVKTLSPCCLQVPLSMKGATVVRRELDDPGRMSGSINARLKQ